MYLIYVLTYFQSKEVVEKTLEVSPYNTVAYGVLVGVLLLALIFVWREYKKLLERHREYVEKTVGVIQIVETKLDSVDNLSKELSGVKTELSHVKEKLGELS